MQRVQSITADDEMEQESQYSRGTNTASLDYNNLPTLCLPATASSSKKSLCCCAICLSSIVVGDVIVQASTTACGHVFHYHCMSDWAQSSFAVRATKYSTNKKRHGDHCVVSLPCPCCRQVFVMATVQQRTTLTTKQYNAASSSLPPASPYMWFASGIL